MHNVLRPLSIHEASFPIYAQLSPGAGNIVACLRVQGALSKDRCEQALRQLMLKEACLQVAHKCLSKDALSDKKSGYFFVQLDDALPIFSISESHGEQFESNVAVRCHTLLNHPFNDGQLLWRSHLLSDYENDQHAFFICINHCISDGASVTSMLTQWLKYINSEKIESYSPKELQPLAESLWSSMPSKIAGFLGGIKSLSMLPAFIKGQKLADKGLNFESGCNVPASEHRCISTFKTLSPKRCEQLVASCKQLNKSMHGLISSGLIHQLLLQCQEDNRLKGFTDRFEFPFVSSVNMRSKLDAVNHGLVGEETVLGCLSSGVVSMVTVDLDEIGKSYHKTPWQIGDQVTRGIKSAFKKNQHWKVLRFYKVVGTKGLKKMFMDASEKPLATPLSLANLGLVNFKQNGSEPLTVKGYEVYAAFHASGAGVNVTANTVNGALTLCFTCPSPAMSQARLDDYAQKVIQTLDLWATSYSIHTDAEGLTQMHA